MYSLKQRPVRWRHQFAKCYVDFLKERCCSGVALLLSKSDFPEGVSVALLPKQHENILIPGNLDSGKDGKLQLYDKAENRAQAYVGLDVIEARILKMWWMFRDHQVNSLLDVGRLSFSAGWFLRFHVGAVVQWFWGQGSSVEFSRCSQ